MARNPYNWTTFNTQFYSTLFSYNTKLMQLGFASAETIWGRWMLMGQMASGQSKFSSREWLKMFAEKLDAANASGKLVNLRNRKQFLRLILRYYTMRRLGLPLSNLVTLNQVISLYHKRAAANAKRLRRRK